MTDMLVKLYDLPPLAPLLAQQAEQGIVLRRAIAPEKHHVLNWIRQHFSEYWVSETDVAYSNHPPSCYLAIENKQLLGFACYDATTKGYFGPTGVAADQQGRGIGKALLVMCLHGMREAGYGYAIIGGVGPIAFYEKAVGAVVIPDSTPGIYGGMLRNS